MCVNITNIIYFNLRNHSLCLNFNLVFCLLYRSPLSKLSITNKQTSPQNEQTTLSSVFDIYITRHVFIWQKVFAKCN